MKYQVLDVLLLNSLSSPSTMASVINLIRHSDNHNLLMSEPVINEMVGKPFNEACLQYFNQNIMLVGIKRGEKTFINPPRDFVIKKDDLAILITE